MSDFLLCSNCGRGTKAVLLKVEVKKRGKGTLTLRRCPRCVERQAQAEQAIRERQERCG